MPQVEPLPITPETIEANVTFEEFLERDWGTPHVEWVNGEVRTMTPISGEHDEVVGFLSGIVRPYVRWKRLGIVRADPFQMKTGKDLPGRAPDLLFLSTANLARLKRTYLEGPADLVIEVLSPGSIETDRREKFAEYERGGVRENWLIDPIRHQAEFYILGTDGRYRAQPVIDGVYRSVAIEGFWVKPAWFWDRPNEFTVFAEWGLVTLP